MKNQFTLEGDVFLYPGDAAWYFVSVDKKISQEIRDSLDHISRGFGSLRVEVTVGKTTWNTSIFPDKKSGTYLLPLKAQVRKKEGITDGSKIKYTLRILA